MLNFSRFNKPLITLEKSAFKGYFFYDKLALRKNWSNIEVEASDWRIELRKQVFPIFGMPQNSPYF
jgi:hypothetical protein